MRACVHACMWSVESGSTDCYRHEVYWRYGSGIAGMAGMAGNYGMHAGSFFFFIFNGLSVRAMTLRWNYSTSM